MLGGATSPGGDDLLTVTIVRDEHGYGMKVSGDNPVYVQSVKEHGAAWRAGLRAGDRILRVDTVPVLRHTHQQVVQMIRANPTAMLTVQQNTSRLKTPITAPVPVNQEKQRQLEVSKVYTMRLMLEQEQKYIRDLRNELSKVPDVRKQAQLESAEQRCSKLQQEIDVSAAGQPWPRPRIDKPNSGFLSGLPRSLSNLTNHSLRNLRQAKKDAITTQPQLLRQNSDETNKRRHNNTVPMVPTTCLDNVSPPPLPPRSVERPKRSPPPVNPLAKPKPSTSNKRIYPDKPFPMHQSMPPYQDNLNKLRRSSHSLDGELEGPQPNSIALQMNYPLVNAPPPPLQMDNRSSLPALHMRSRSSPEQLDSEPPKSARAASPAADAGAARPPGTPPPPYHHNTQPCADPQRAIISMEEDDSPASDNSTYSGLFSNLRAVRESKARTAVLLNWLLGERRCACANLLLILTDGYRGAAGAQGGTLRRWAYEIHSTFLIPSAVLQLNGVDENIANEIEHVLVNEYDKEELLRNVFRKARQKAKEELSQQLSEFQVKRQVGLGTLYGPEDAVLEKCDVDKAQELVVVERLVCGRLSAVSSADASSLAACGAASADAHAALVAALAATAVCLHARAASVAAAAAGGARATFLQRDKLYKQRLKQLAKQHPQPYVVRGHHLQLQALTSVAHCHHCDHVIWGLAPQAYVCTDCKLRVHRACARSVEEGCCLDTDHHNNRISRFMERIQQPNVDSNEKKSRKASSGHFLNMERSFRKQEDDQAWDQTLTPASSHGEPKREGSADEQPAPDPDVDPSDVAAKDTVEKDSNWRTTTPSSGRGVNRAESCRERDAPRRGKHRNASDPNRLTAHTNHDLEPGATTAPSGSSSSSSLSSRSNESNTVAAEQQASQSDWSEEEEPLAAQWADSLPPRALETMQLCPRLRKRQEVIHELIVSEGSHVRWLKVLCRVFLRPLEGAPSLLPAEELRALFPNLPDVRDWHVGLHARLRALRTNAPQHVVQLRDLAAALLATLGEPTYASCLSRFCRGQRLALESLRERRRKNKELHQFLSSREQLPLCGRLQLRDLLACVWQRLTKYRLLLESVLKTVSEEEDDPEDVERLHQVLHQAKDMLHSVDTAIRTTENEHRLRSIQAKLEVRTGGGGGGEWDELRRLELGARSLRHEGELGLRLDTHRKTNVLALMFEDMLVLLQREGDKFLLKPISQQHGLLSPLIKWDKVLFRPNAAVRNTFFLMNINGVQMHELSANTAAEYTTWVNCIQEAPLARVELKQTITPAHHASRSTDDSGINVSRNPSDASEKSTTTTDEPESDKERTPAPPECERDSTPAPAPAPDDEREDVKDKEELLDKEDKDDKQIPRRPTVGKISTQAAPPALEPAPALTVLPPAALQLARTAVTHYTHQERLRRLDEGIEAALRAKAAIVGQVLGVPPQLHTHLAELAVADTLGHVDVRSELLATRQGSKDGSDGGDDALHDAPDLRQLLLAAHAQASQLTEAISRALNVNEAAVVAARARRGRCDACGRRARNEDSSEADTLVSGELTNPALERQVQDSMTMLDRALQAEAEAGAGAGAVAGAVAEVDAERALESNLSAAALAARLASLGGGLQGCVRGLLQALPALERQATAARRQLAQARDGQDHRNHADYQMTDEIYFLKPDAEQPIQDLPSNGG